MAVLTRAFISKKVPLWNTTIIESDQPIRIKAKKETLEMQQNKKGKQWFFWLKSPYLVLDG